MVSETRLREIVKDAIYRPDSNYEVELARAVEVLLPVLEAAERFAEFATYVALQPESDALDEAIAAARRVVTKEGT